MEYKICTVCNDELPETTEYFECRKNGKLRHSCLICRQIFRMKSFRKNKDRILKQNREWYYENRNYRLAQCKQYNNAHSEIVKRRRSLRNSSPILSSSKVFKSLSEYEDTRLDPKNNDLGQVKCRYCGEYFNPTFSECHARQGVIFRDEKGECNLYCSDHCKQACSTYGQILYPKGFKKSTSREVQPELRKLVLERDNWECQKCGKTQQESQLHCHHIEGIHHNPIESADVDMCITLCRECHKEVHKREGCTYVDMRCAS